MARKAASVLRGIIGDVDPQRSRRSSDLAGEALAVGRVVGEHGEPTDAELDAPARQPPRRSAGRARTGGRRRRRHWSARRRWRMAGREEVRLPRPAGRQRAHCHCSSGRPRRCNRARRGSPPPPRAAREGSRPSSLAMILTGSAGCADDPLDRVEQRSGDDRFLCRERRDDTDAQLRPCPSVWHRRRTNVRSR